MVFLCLVFVLFLFLFYRLLSTLRSIWIYTCTWMPQKVFPWHVHSRPEMWFCVICPVQFPNAPAISLKSDYLLMVSIFIVFLRIVWVILYFIGLVKKPHFFFNDHVYRMKWFCLTICNSAPLLQDSLLTWGPISAVRLS